MKKSDVHEYWRDPNSDRFNVGEKYRAKCQPEYYVQFSAVSEMWLDVFEKFIPVDASILELGCSVGRNLYYLKRDGYTNLAGVEINPRARLIAANEYGQDVADMITTSSIEEYIFQPVCFDVLFASGVLMHIHPDSDSVFPFIGSRAHKFLMVAEVERPTGLYKWPRNYRAIFEGLGFTQIHEQEATPMSNRTTLRVFKRVE